MSVKRRRWKRGDFNPWRDRPRAVVALLAARRGGATLAEAATVAGVHIATACRWANRSPALRTALDDARRFAKTLKHRRRPRRRPNVPTRRQCPDCGGAVQVRTADGRLKFWRCARWPRCPWASWRPRAPWDCPACGGSCLWSHSRKSVSCSRCGGRWRPILAR